VNIRKATPEPPVVTAAAGLPSASVSRGLLKPEEKLGAYDGLATDEFVK